MHCRDSWNSSQTQVAKESGNLQIHYASKTKLPVNFHFFSIFHLIQERLHGLAVNTRILFSLQSLDKFSRRWKINHYATYKSVLQRSLTNINNNKALISYMLDLSLSTSAIILHLDHKLFESHERQSLTQEWTIATCLMSYVAYIVSYTRW